MASSSVTPFEVAVPRDRLDDLVARLARTRWTGDFANDDWRYGASTAALRPLADYWRDGYDWRATEARINAWPNRLIELDGVRIHFLHAAGRGPAPMPLMLNHGWPWTFWDYRKLLGPLSDPAAHGGDPADAFELVVPSLPGFGFSTPLTRTGISFVETADLWVRLMTALGHDRFATQGADWGAFVSAQLGHKYADRVIGVHTQLLAPLGTFAGEAMPDPADFTDAEQDRAARNARFHAEGFGYAALQTTKPQTPAVALADSPVGLLAWLAEKRRDWSDSEGDLYRRFSRDDLLDSATIYWLTDCYHTSARYYYEAVHRPWRPSHDRWPRVEAPVGVASFPAEIVVPPRAWTERYYNVRRFTRMPSGGHFGAMEEPEALIDDIRAFFRPLRSA